MRLAAFFLALLLAAPLHAATFTVDSVVDAVDAAPGDGICADAAESCTLRAAIQETNALPGPDQISLPAGTYVLSIPGRDEFAAASGDLNVTDDLSVVGAGSALTIVDAAGLDRVFRISASASLRSLTVTRGASYEEGGGVLVVGGSFELRYAEIRQNTSYIVGGGLSIAGDYVHATIADSTIAGNSAGGAAALWLIARHLTMINTTGSGNSGQIPGFFPAIHAWTLGKPYNVSLVLINSTVVANDNAAAIGGNALMDLAGSVITNEGTGPACEESFYRYSLGHNIDSDGTCSLFDPTDLPNTDPLLGPLQDNGGPTWTHALLPGSPAIDAIPEADCTWDDDGDPGTPEVPVNSDQRGVPRPQNANCDIGAFEVNECADGANNDGDAFTDYPDDPGCYDATWLTESPQCQDGINNDPGQDALIDFDGGLSVLGYVASDPDPQCVGLPWKNKERTGCGIGSFELALILPGLMWLHRRRRRLH
jgi:CSLREA domain-containing protein